MSSGRRYLASLDRALDKLRREFRELDSELQNVTRGLATVRRRETDAYRALADLRLDDLEKQTFHGQLDDADRRAEELLEAREKALAELSTELDRIQADLAALADLREVNVDALEVAEERLADLVEDVGRTLAAEPDFQADVKHNQALVNKAASAEEKTARAEQDRRDKGKPYEDDPLFSYLHERGYGTSAYRAWPLARLVDRMMARHIGFEKARRNYYLLTEIPLRLRRHTERLEAEAARSMNALAERERAAEVAAGIESLEANVSAARDDSAATDAKITEKETRYAELLTERESFANGKDEFFTAAMAALVKNFKAEPIPQLQREAELSVTYSDDKLVHELASLRDEARQLERHLDDKKDIHGRRMSRMNELLAVRNQYKTKRFDALDSIIDDRGNAEMMLSEFLRGLESGERLWRVIRHSQRFRPRITRSRSGSIGGVRVPRTPRSVRLPRGMSGGGGFKVPRMPSGGGFRTKGGF